MCSFVTKAIVKLWYGAYKHKIAIVYYLYLIIIRQLPSGCVYFGSFGLDRCELCVWLRVCCRLLSLLLLLSLPLLCVVTSPPRAVRRSEKWKNGGCYLHIESDKQNVICSAAAAEKKTKQNE